MKRRSRLQYMGTGIAELTIFLADLLQILLRRQSNISSRNQSATFILVSCGV